GHVGIEHKVVDGNIWQIRWRRANANRNGAAHVLPSRSPIGSLEDVAYRVIDRNPQRVGSYERKGRESGIGRFTRRIRGIHDDSGYRAGRQCSVHSEEIRKTRLTWRHIISKENLTIIDPHIDHAGIAGRNRDGVDPITA